MDNQHTLELTESILAVSIYHENFMETSWFHYISFKERQQKSPVQQIDRSLRNQDYLVRCHHSLMCNFIQLNIVNLTKTKGTEGIWTARFYPMLNIDMKKLNPYMNDKLCFDMTYGKKPIEEAETMVL